MAEVEAASGMGPIADGLLMMDSMIELPLRGHPSVMLSGSHGGAGYLSHDALLGLPRTLVACGARSVIASMWEVADEPAAALSEAFYARLVSSPKMAHAEALRHAILTTRAKWPHAAYWAGYTLLGVPTGL